MSRSKNNRTVTKRLDNQKHVKDCMAIVSANGIRAELVLPMAIFMSESLVDEEMKKMITPIIKPEIKGLICYSNQAFPIIQSTEKTEYKWFRPIWNSIINMWSSLPNEQIVLWIEASKGPFGYIEKYNVLWQLLQGLDIFFIREMRYYIIEMLFKISLPLPPSIPSD